MAGVGPGHTHQVRGGGTVGNIQAGIDEQSEMECTRVMGGVGSDRQDNLHHIDHMVGIQVDFSHSWLAGVRVVGVAPELMESPCTQVRDLTAETLGDQRVHEELRSLAAQTDWHWCNTVAGSGLGEGSHNSCCDLLE